MSIIRKLRFSEIELKELGLAWIAISLAFSIVRNRSADTSFLVLLGLSAFTVGVGFLLHEVAHKLVAQRYNCFAEFRSDKNMLLTMIFLSFFGFLFAAPGAVMISGNITKRRNGIISMWGPLTNFLLAIVFLLIGVFTPFKTLGFFGAQINTFIGLFNLLPFSIIDGRKVFDWNKKVYSALVIFGVVLLFLTY
ncbi:metalloprotease [Candidatus Woesearchaeota archaeon]|nr:metalloprotease [Candidatus Woesearchaeota archaeon]